MKMIRTISAICLLGFLSACAVGEMDTDGYLYSGQWTKPKPMGNDKFFLEGYHTTNAINGATQFCKEKGKMFDSIDLTPSNDADGTRATLIFKCV
ncbi:hypothetical protein OAA92_01710 [Candidatus Pelagibacter sp.]|nr:hypothetical protein [Candidatus Pelagibacter sp.]